MANPSFWAFKRGKKWHSGWRDERGRCHSKVHPIGATKTLAQEFGRKMPLEASPLRAGQTVRVKDMPLALELFLTRKDVKPCPHDLNRRHLEAFVGHFKLRTVE